MTENLWHVKFGRTVACALISSLLAAALPALRMAAGTGRFGTWLVIATLGLPLALLLSVLLQGTRGAAGFSLESVAPWAAGVCIWLSSAYVLGSLFRKVTHHRALGAVTIAIGLAVLLVVLFPLAHRVSLWLSGKNDWLARSLGILSLGLVFAIGAVLVSRSGSTPLALAGTDALVLLVLSVVVEGLLPAYDRALLMLGLPLAVLLTGVGVSRGLCSFPPNEAPLYGWIALKCPGVASQVDSAH